MLYNWKYQSSYGGEAAQTGMEDRFNFSTINMIANYYKAGPATDEKARRRIVEPSEQSPATTRGAGMSRTTMWTVILTSPPTTGRAWTAKTTSS